MKKDYLEEGAMADTADLVVLGAYYGTGNKGKSFITSASLRNNMVLLSLTCRRGVSFNYCKVSSSSWYMYLDITSVEDIFTGFNFW